jgi:hypothetical protein
MKLWPEKNKYDYAVYIGIASLTVVISFTVLLFVNEETQYHLTKEDGFFESVGAVGWFITFVVFFYIFWKNKSGNNLIFLRTKRNLVFFILGTFCFIACGEEISWGQRIFEIQTPDFLKKINRQDETNLHNIVFLQSQYANSEDLPFWVRMLSMTRIFQAFWFVYCVLLPLASRFNHKIYYYIKNMNIPLIPIGLGVVFLANYSISRIIPLIYNMSFNSNDHYFVEIKESNFGILFMLVSLYFLQNITNDKTVYKYATDSLYEFKGQPNLATDQLPVPALTSNVFCGTRKAQACSDSKSSYKL